MCILSKIEEKRTRHTRAQLGTYSKEHNPRVYTKIEGELPVGYPGSQSAALKGDILAGKQFSFTVVLVARSIRSWTAPTFLHFIKKLKEP